MGVASIPIGTDQAWVQVELESQRRRSARRTASLPNVHPQSARAFGLPSSPFEDAAVE